jgi:PPOX class probable F420-dependent enzyme
VTRTALSALVPERYISLETFKKNGDGVKTPVWFAPVGEALYVFTDGTSFKVKRVRRDGRARIAGCNSSGSTITTPWFDAQASILEPGPEEDAAYAALRSKYGWQIWLLDIGSRLSGRIKRRKVIRLGVA